MDHGVPGAGLCNTCRNARAIVSGKGSVFLMCELSKTDPRFRKYPPLPVMRCEGWEKLAGDSANSETTD